MPYSYYQLFRFTAIIGFAILAYYEYERKNIPLVIVFVGLALLFQSLVKVALGRHTWNIVDVVVVVGLVVTLFVQKRKAKFGKF
jgi:asparagine N-glycosylation enzyme membrane subunit Stt3